MDVENRTLVFTLGFDIKYQVKTIIELGRNINRFISIVNSDKSEKVLKALEEIDKFVRDYLEAEVETWEIDFSNVDKAFLELCKRFSSLRNGEVIIDVSGGMRIMGILTLFAAIVTLEPKDIRIYLWTEDGKTRADISFVSYIPLRPALSELSRKALRVIADRGEISLTELSQSMDKPKPSVYRAVRELLKLGLINEYKRGRASVYRLTPKGSVMAYMDDSEGD
ncbi:CRISPR-associated CARF protein Csa3 [Desulfurococcus mucosus]|uniref:CRISPR locus-related DNA-binding protein n=1 Tax=Desulfurococcus mucosus (strain ATCC 35584 / DSM 2162 / JCM 9187 / O7/1) TaxID=765177 RepID=E8R9X5_DESM0|nr:CRISPR-associated CARF protein Csa3 [Desulfurococcus mucosus]ADV65301.1 CRISPR locus-related DNA-binding protein [Desulfurococcus mucosus DSM 2162]